jgi:hypothetical protein
LENFSNNDDIIEAHNALNSTYTLGHNQFSHLNVDEWRQFVRLGLDRPSGEADFIHKEPSDASTLP